jgi:nitrate reductase NapE component
MLTMSRSSERITVFLFAVFLLVAFVALAFAAGYGLGRILL